MAVPAEAAIFIGQILDGRFEVTTFLAAGGFCMVFEANDLHTGRSVAVKVLGLSPSAEGALEFATERELLTALASASNVVDVIAGGQAAISLTGPGGVAVPLTADYVALELADAAMTDLLATLSGLGWGDRLKLFRGVVLGVHQMHLARIVHRDVKSENVLLFRRPGGSGDSKVTDLGRSRDTSRPARFGPDAYVAGRGDLRFAPPELLWMQGEDTEECWRCVDLYQLGSVFFELGTGQGLTFMALGNGPAIVKMVMAMPSKDRPTSFRAQLPAIRARYEVPYGLFQAQLPPSIRDEAMRLLRRITDPDPGAREPRVGAGNPWSLEWLLHRIDIMSLLISTSARGSIRGRRSRP